MRLQSTDGTRRRVAVTGMGVRSPLGHTPEALHAALREGRSGIQRVEAWAALEGIDSLVAGVVHGVDGKTIPRKQRRSMGRTSILAVEAARDAVAQAGLGEAELLGGQVGVSMASTIGSARAIDEYCVEIARSEGARGLRSTAFLQFMGHSAAANVALALGVTGRSWSPTSACASGNQAIGLAAEQIACGRQEAMIAGGAEELHHTVVATFCVTGAASRRYNDQPDATPRPFDASRDGLVVGEGAGVLVLEEWDRAVARGAPILAEVAGFATATDPRHMTDPDPDAMERCVLAALDDAGLMPSRIGYVNAHATGTERGDPAEAEACRRVYGDAVPISSTKGFTGHGLGAAGGVESVICVQALQQGWLPPTLNLQEVDPGCTGLDLLRGGREAAPGAVANHSFAFGGVASVLIFAARSE